MLQPIIDHLVLPLTDSSMKPTAIIFDLDWTLCELKPDSERNNHTGNEKPIEWMIEIVNSFENIDHIIILTGRKEKYADITWKWLDRVDFSELIMQEWRTAKKNHVFKREQLEKLKERYDILAVVDDNPAMIEVCRDLNIILLQVHTWTNQHNLNSEKTNG